MRTLFGCLLIIFAGVYGGASQDGSQPVSAGAPSAELSSLVADEARRGIYVFYTQSFIDRENKRASYRGSVFGAIQKFELKGCELEIEATIVDKFSGTVGQEPTGPLQDTYRYAASLELTPEIAAGASLIEARPAQLGRSTHSVCDEVPSCSFRWLRFQTKQKIIRETSTMNDSIDFGGQVDHFVVPVSSSEMGKRIIEELGRIADSHCH